MGNQNVFSDMRVMLHNKIYATLTRGCSKSMMHFVPYREGRKETTVILAIIPRMFLFEWIHVLNFVTVNREKSFSIVYGTWPS